MKLDLIGPTVGLAAALTGSVANAALIDFSAMQLNGGATVNGGVLNVGTNGGADMSAFITTPISTTSSFSGSFEFTLTNNGSPFNADGVAFVIQNSADGARALGAGGGGLGADGISNMVGIGFQSYTNNRATIFTTATTPTGGTGSNGNFSLGSNASDDVTVTFSYSSVRDALSFTAHNSATGQRVTQSYGVDLTTLGSSVYLGLSGGTGGYHSEQDFTSFNVTVAPEPSTWAMLIIGFGGLGALAYRARRGAVSAA
ncbi:putative secreted protein with PEP-CTERM sorting signal [Roseiarcus fermentans]|uniref:Putative secreted protein with PEP-CTERM sorting signal n=1 Tax=Roseiarcus fermentans TaxID=1473586 RepID=A0A366EF30_9HYPH|nr:PEP-CTERM sorting domain-containing protein [Roseiarcus fermentans]RBP00928.1 putative secreted protein with PEP-CTERM sorting signal [Roseiarcus fermentans]